MCDLYDGPSPSFEAFVSDPLIRLVMASDGLTDDDMREVLEAARAAICARAMEGRPVLTLVE